MPQDGIEETCFPFFFSFLNTIVIILKYFLCLSQIHF